MNIIKRGNAWLHKHVIAKINPRFVYIGALGALVGSSVWHVALDPSYSWVGAALGGAITSYVAAHVIAWRAARRPGMTHEVRRAAE